MVKGPSPIKVRPLSPLDGGAITWQAAYEAYGKRTVEYGSTVERQKANSKEEDPTGLLNEGFRYRDLEFGVWLTRDPAGFVDGPNLYAYVRRIPGQRLIRWNYKRLTTKSERKLRTTYKGFQMR